MYECRNEYRLASDIAGMLKFEIPQALTMMPSVTEVPIDKYALRYEKMLR